MIPLSRGVYLRNGSQRAHVVSNSQAVSSRSRTARREGGSPPNASPRDGRSDFNRGSLTHDCGRITGDSEVVEAGVKNHHPSARSNSATVSRRRITFADFPFTSTSAGRGRVL